MHLWRAAVIGEFKSMTIRVKEINALEYRVIGRANNVDARGLELRFGCEQSLERIHFHSQMLHPGWCIAIAIHLRLGW